MTIIRLILILIGVMRMKTNHDIRIDLNKLHPYLKYKLKLLLNACEKQNIYLIITEGFRTKEYQDELYAQGRTKPGIVVTNARGSDYSSQHQWGVAFDIAINDNKLLYNVDMLTKVSNIAKSKSIKLGWGGDWKSPVDRPHFYLSKWGSTPLRLKVLYRTFDNFKKTWTAQVRRKKGIAVWDKTHKKKKDTLVYATQVNVLWKHIRWAKVEYKDNAYGYVKSRFIK